MKCGIKALLITLAIACHYRNDAGALAVSPAAKTQSVQSKPPRCTGICPN